ncbi:hypothetical protein [Stenotrophomonas sp. PS02289]|uniref:hypothetical protein n=1 Tax=Stenotrophomonas sp. PS02289 TaxID=2991422 RepID=UPI00249A0B00|nr:hypothetical protein [Stenotrophomonas sp. PS02289]
MKFSRYRTVILVHSFAFALAMMIAQPAGAAMRECVAVEAVLTHVAETDHGSVGIVSVRNSGDEVISLDWGGRALDPKLGYEVEVLHPVSYFVQSRSVGDSSWIPHIVLGTFAPPDGSVEVKAGDRANVAVGMEGIRQGSHEEEMEFSVNLFDRETGCSVTTQSFQKSDFFSDGPAGLL